MELYLIADIFRLPVHSNFSSENIFQMQNFNKTNELFTYLGFMACQDHFTHFEPSQVIGGVKTGDPGENHLSHMWPEPGSNPKLWGDEWFRALKINILNHSAMGSTS